AGGWAAEAAVRGCPLHRRADEDRGVIDAGAAAIGAVAAAIDLVAVVLVIGDPVNVIQGAVVILPRIIVIVSECLQTVFFRRQALVPMREDVPPGLVAAIVETAPTGVCAAGAQGQAQHRARDQGEALHCNSFGR